MKQPLWHSTDSNVTRLSQANLLTTRDEPILQAKFLEKYDYESKEQNTGKIGGVSQQNQMLYLNR